MRQRTTEIRPAAPFSLELTAGYQTYFRGHSGADLLHQGTYCRLLERQGRPLLLMVCSASSPEEIKAPVLRVDVAGPDVSEDDLRWAAGRATWVLNTDLDLGPFYQMAAGDPRLAYVAHRLRGLHPPRVPTLFEGLVQAICGQQISSQVAWVIRNLLIQRYGATLELNGQVYQGFPSPEALVAAGVEGLRGAKLSTRKAEYIVDIAALASSGELDTERFAGLSDEEAAERLLRLRGVGGWTIEWVLLRALGRPAVFPAGDLALRRVVADLYNGGEPLTEKEARSIADAWGPLRAQAVVYLFAALRLALLAEAGRA
ncbi:MAG: DNA-3-methyladenine glycosylase 2 family protein [Chloroflexi bacterium]|nr:DNA-3-methyladenine glycosylase 2 family protein [Chloroflexota bacterium]